MFEVVFNDNEFKSIDNYLDPFLKSLDIKQSSKNTYRRQLKEFFIWLNKNNKSRSKIEKPTRDHILEYKNYLRDKQMLASLTVSAYITAVRRYFEWLEAIKVYPNIAKGIKGLKRKRGFRKDALNLDLVRKLLSSIDRSNITGLRDYAMLNLMIRTGLRTIEITRASREDISGQGGEYVLWIHGKGRDSKDEMVLLTESTLQPIRDYLIARKKVRDEDPIFASHSTKNYGKRLTTRSISRIVKERLKAIGLNDSRLTAHSLRHTAITLSLLAGATPQEARAMARHSDINTTLIYAHNINRIQQAPERKIDDFLKM